jgi:ATP-dependent DNA helicase RecQ
MSDMGSTAIDRAREILAEVFGYEAFRPLQAEIIEAVMKKSDALVVMPTGGGKSICYQIPALMFSGLTVVISPLISLMKDQVDQMKQLGVEAVLLNSSISRDEYGSNIALIRDGTAKLLYVAPETLLKNDILLLLTTVTVDCFAIDEAHCISEWGHDFRPEYRMIAQVRKRFPRAVCMALTATATERVRGDIRKNLEMSETSDFIASFNRDNLFYRITQKNDALKQTLEFLSGHKGESGIIYAFSRDSVDRIYMSLKKHGYSVRPYHAGLADEDRRKNQELFLKDEVQIIVATIAFGMGIHKTNVRFVIHYDLPKSIEAYYQETGRAGRDGVDSTCLLLYSYSDIHKIRYFIDQKPDETEKKAAVSQLNALVNYADSECCRRIPLITYFGEEYSRESCGMCDNCVSPQEQGDDLTLAAQMFLSCVKRTGEKFGTGHIVQVLRGSGAARIRELGHNGLSTYGIGKDYSVQSWKNMARQFVTKGLLIQDMQSYGELKLTEKGHAVMRGFEKVMGRFGENATAQKKPISGISYDGMLFELLREKRRALAAEANVPPYVIFSDKTLMAIAEAYPQSRESLMTIHGIGAHKIQKFGEIIISIVKEYCEEKGIIDKTVEIPAPREYVKKPRHVQIGELYNAGRSITEIEAAEGVQRITVISNLKKYVQDGYSITSAGLRPLLSLDAERILSVIAAFDRHGHEFLKPVFEELGGSVDYDTLQICRLYYLCSD